MQDSLFNAQVVYLLIPTSNHNMYLQNYARFVVVYLLIPTSNHNPDAILIEMGVVVYLLIPTSNHNYAGKGVGSGKLYIF